MAESTTIRWEQDDDGIVLLTLDDPNQSANTMNARLRGVDGRDGRPPGGREGRRSRASSITSAKKTFFAGGDLNDLQARRPRTTRRELAEMVRGGKAQLRRLETLGKPVVRGDQRRRARRRPRDLPGQPPPHRGR